jgi:glycerol uptake facilitator-like aquaporin
LDTFILKPASTDAGLAQIFFIEMMFTTMFISVILHTKYGKTAPTEDAMIGTITVALTLYGLIGMVGASDGGCFNPTIGLTVTTF